MRRHPADHILALMLDKLNGTISESDRQYLDNLIAQDEQVRQAWEQLCNRFSPADLENNFERLHQPGRWKEIPAIPQKRGARVTLRRSAWAAAALLGILVAGYYMFPFNSKKADPPVATNNARTIQLQLANGATVNLSQPAADIQLDNARLHNQNKSLSFVASGEEPAGAENILTVPPGADYKVALPDGTEIWLNSATTLRFPFRFTTNAREIAINGEAYVKVAAQAGRPFIVHTPHSTVQVLGTEFNLNTYDSGQVKVALVSGAVRLQAGGQAVTVKPDQEAVYTLQQGITVNAFDKTDVLSWRNGICFFRNATLEEIANVLPRWYGVTVVMDNPASRRKKFSGRLDRNEPLSSFLDNLKATTALDYSFDSNGVLHLQ